VEGGEEEEEEEERRDNAGDDCDHVVIPSVGDYG
jgi:hypothetical protein